MYYETVSPKVAVCPGQTNPIKRFKPHIQSPVCLHTGYRQFVLIANLRLTYIFPGVDRHKPSNTTGN